MNITRETVRQLGDDVKLALEQIAQKHGLKLVYGGGSYMTGASYKPKVEFHAIGEDGLSEKNRREFELGCRIWGLKPEHLGQRIRVGRESYTITGLTTGTKYPVLATRADGKTYKLPIESVRYALGLGKL